MFINIPEEYQDKFAMQVAETRIKDYVCPNNADEYWQVVDKYWPLILDIVLRFCSDNIFSVDSKYFGKKLAVVLTSMKLNRDTEICNFFDQAWYNAPDTGHIHLIPGWEILCDLCSESYLVK